MGGEQNGIPSLVFDHLAAVERDFSRLVQSVEVLKPIAFDQKYMNRFSNNYSAHVAGYLQDALSMDCVSCVCRLWDHASDAYSIPNLIEFITKEKVWPHIIARNSVAPIVIDGFNDLPEICGDSNFVEHLNSARNWRHKYAAHNLMQTNMEKKSLAAGTSIEPLRWGDLEFLLSHTSHAYRIVSRLITCSDPDIDGERNTWALYSEKFWKSVSETPL